MNSISFSPVRERAGNGSVVDFSPSSFLIGLVLYAFGIWAFYSLVESKPFSTQSAPSLSYTSEGYIYRAEKFLYSDEDPQVVLLGSSLILKPSYSCDIAFEGLKKQNSYEADWQAKREHIRALHFEHALSDKGFRNIQTANLGIPATTVEDYKLLLQRAIEFHKHPNVVVIALAPRDFADPKQEKDSLVYQRMQVCSASSNLIDCLKHPRHTIGLMFSRLPIAHSLLCLSQRIVWEKNCLLTGLKNQIFLAAAHKAPASPNAPVAPANHALPAAAVPKAGASMAELGEYQRIYDAATPYRLRERMIALAETIDLAKAHGISVEVVSMPLSQSNRALINQQWLASYNSQLKFVCTQLGCRFVDCLSENKFQDSHFVDSCHLDATGGHMLFAELAANIAMSPTRLVKSF